MQIPGFAAENITDPYTFWLLAILCSMMVGYSKCGIAGTGILLPMLVAGDVFTVIHYRRHAVWKHVLRALPWAIAGIIGGYLCIGWMKESQADIKSANIILKHMIGWIVLTVLLMGEWVQRRKAEDALKVPNKWWFAAAIGIIGGFSTMAANAAGPIWTIYLLALLLPKESFLGTSGWTFLILNTFKLPFSHSLGYINAESLLFDLKMLPAIALGAFLGIKTLKYVPQRAFSIAVKILAAAAAVKLLLA
jgi:uncharacterized membrane protein YfcA